MKNRLSNVDVENLRREKIIDNDTANKILDFLADNNKNSGHHISILNVFFAVLAAILIGGGIILIGAKNWVNMSVPVKTIISIAPLLVSQSLVIWVLKKRSNSIAWCEGVSIFMTASVFAAIALIGQIYHLSGDFCSFALTCGLLFLPVMYVLNSVSVLPIYFICVMCSPVKNSLGVLALLLLCAPYIFYQTHYEKINFKMQIIYWSMAITGFWFVTVMSENLFVVLSYALITLSVDILFNENENLVLRPFSILSGAFLIAMLFLYSFLYGTNLLHLYNEPISVIIILILSLAISFISLAKSKCLPNKILLASFAIVLLLLLAKLGFLLTVFCNIALIAYSVALIYYGVREELISVANFGMLLALILIFIRFLDLNMSILTRGIAFILCGLVFLLANFYIGKRSGK